MWMSDATEGMHNTKYASEKVELMVVEKKRERSLFHFQLFVSTKKWHRRNDLFWLKDCCKIDRPSTSATRCWKQSIVLDKHHVNKPRHFYRRKFKMEWLEREFPRYRQARGNAINNEMCALIHMNPFCIFFLLIKYFDILLTVFNTRTVERLERRRLNKH